MKVIKEEIIHSKRDHTVSFLRIIKISDKEFRTALSRDEAGEDTSICFICPNERAALSTFDFIKMQLPH